MADQLNSIVLGEAQTVAQQLQGELTSLKLPLTLKGLEKVLRGYNVNEKTIKAFYDLFQKYLIKDGKLHIPEF